MKRAIVYGAVLMLTIITLAAFTGTQSSITGKVKPADGAETVLLISGKDTARHAITSGSFAISVNPGIYKLIIDGKPPYQDILMENVEVKPGMTLDLGEIFLKT
jgi:hypothetical protein